MVVMVVVWTVSWPRRERCPGTLLFPVLFAPFLFLLLLRRICFLTRRCSPFLCLFSLSLFPLYLSVKLPPAFPRSFYRGLSRAGRPFRAAPVNQYGGGPVSAFPRRAGEEAHSKKAYREKFMFCALESELFVVFPDA